jgi:flagellar assembly protein FliH
MSDPKSDNLDPEAWRRWEMADLGSTKPARPALGSKLSRRLAEQPQTPAAQTGTDPATTNLHPIPDDVLAHVAQIGKNVREAARTEGYAEGLKKGHAEGFAKGKAEAQKIGHDEGFQAGHREGYEKGLAEARALGNAEAQRLQQLVNEFTASVQALDAQIADSVVDLALNIARQVIRSTFVIAPEKVVETVRDILQADTNSDTLMYLRLHPEDMALLKRHLSDDPRLHKWHLEPDERIERGGCIAETSLGDIDATLKTRWERVAGTLSDHAPWIENP